MQVMKARERVNKWFVPESPEQSPIEQADVVAWHQNFFNFPNVFCFL